MHLEWQELRTNSQIVLGVACKGDERDDTVEDVSDHLEPGALLSAQVVMKGEQITRRWPFRRLGG